MRCHAHTTQRRDCTRNAPRTLVTLAIEVLKSVHAASRGKVANMPGEARPADPLTFSLGPELLGQGVYLLLQKRYF